MLRVLRSCQVGWLLFAIVGYLGGSSLGQEPEIDAEIETEMLELDLVEPEAVEPKATEDDDSAFESVDPSPIEGEPVDRPMPANKIRTCSCPACGAVQVLGPGDRAVGLLRRSYAEHPNGVDNGRARRAPSQRPGEEASPYAFEQAPSASRAEVLFQSLPYLEQFIENAREGRPATRTPATAPLKPGEAAQVILELRERLGDSALDGTDFGEPANPAGDAAQGGGRDELVDLIRALDEEYQRREVERASHGPTPSSESGPGPDSPAGALRATARHLDEAADVLEQQSLFERADQLRDLADELRHQARSANRTEALPPTAWRKTDAAGGRHAASHDATALLADQVQQIRDEVRRLGEALSVRTAAAVDADEPSQPHTKKNRRSPPAR